jgi:hypothetical protein
MQGRGYPGEQQGERGEVGREYLSQFPVPLPAERGSIVTHLPERKSGEVNSMCGEIPVCGLLLALQHCGRMREGFCEAALRNASLETVDDIWAHECGHCRSICAWVDSAIEHAGNQRHALFRGVNAV